MAFTFKYCPVMLNSNFLHLNLFWMTNAIVLLWIT
jgi:hypothetical protein